MINLKVIPQMTYKDEMAFWNILKVIRTPVLEICPTRHSCFVLRFFWLWVSGRTCFRHWNLRVSTAIVLDARRNSRSEISFVKPFYMIMHTCLYTLIGQIHHSSSPQQIFSNVNNVSIGAQDFLSRVSHRKIQ